MGDFNYTCAVSGLPIGGGDKVRFILLQASPYTAGGTHAAQVTDRWYVRLPPVRAEYNTYGTVENVHPDDAGIARLWLKSFDADLIEKGVGDNTVHDVAARKGMTFDELRDALWEQRIEVVSDIDREWRANIDRMYRRRYGNGPVPRGVPTIRRVEARIRKAGSVMLTIRASSAAMVTAGEPAPSGAPGYVVRGPGGSRASWSTDLGKALGVPMGEDGAPVVGSHTIELSTVAQSGDGHGGAFLVDEMTTGKIRVRVAGYATTDEAAIRLYALARHMRRKYAVVVTCGSGSYGWSPEMLVYPKPGLRIGTPGREHAFTLEGEERRGRPETLHVRQIMVREDVWQALLRGKAEVWTARATTHVQLRHYLKDAREAWDAYLNILAKARKSKVPARTCDAARVSEGRALLGLAADATPGAVKAAWRAYVLRAHPDKGGDAGVDLDAAKRLYEATLKASKPRRRVKKAWFLRPAQMMWESWARDHENVVAYQVSHDHTHGAFGLPRAWALAAASKMSDAERDTFLRAVAELCLIERILATTRQVWRPVGHDGPQYGEWAEHASVLRAYLGCATKVIAQQRKAQAAQDRWWRAYQKKEAAKKKRRAQLRKAAKSSP